MDDELLATFRRAASTVPAYRRILEEHGVEPSAIVDRQTFSTLCPILTKANTFDRFPIDRLCVDGTIQNLANVLTSSGHGGRFSFGLSTRQQHAESASMIDDALDQAFKVRSRRTLVINCLPMGVVFSSEATTVATTSVREDMATALLTTFGSHYEQVLIVSDPLFLRRLIDYGDATGVQWKRYRLGVVLGEEIFGEHFRAYVARRLGLDLDRPDSGYIMSSFGVGELGLHLCYETPATIAVRRAALDDPALACELFGGSDVLPMVLAYNDARTLIETPSVDQSGYGRLTISMLDPTLPMPLLRYQTGDVVRVLDPSRVIFALWRRGVNVQGPLPPMLALAGREKERLPNGSYVGAYKDALYADGRIADHVTGAFRVTAIKTGFVIVHVQLVHGTKVGPDFADRVRSALCIPACAGQVVISNYEDFPYGMSLDYERKFSYYVAGEARPMVESVTAEPARLSRPRGLRTRAERRWAVT
jgi:phenylacetate-coenzyme A ligase PaaK-like adenylate-forming protein